MKRERGPSRSCQGAIWLIGLRKKYEGSSPHFACQLFSEVASLQPVTAREIWLASFLVITHSKEGREVGRANQRPTIER
ncbi:MAG: hypothetical protein ACO394_08540, partial [Blastocatellia bacterium]